MTKMADIPMYGKKLKMFFSRIKSHEASGLKLDDPSLTLPIFRKYRGMPSPMQYTCMTIVLNIFFSKTSRLFIAKFIWILIGKGGIIDIDTLGHMTKMAAMPIYSKKNLRILFQNQKSDDLETCYEPLGT